MIFTTEEIAYKRKLLAGATNWDDLIGVSEYLAALDEIERLEARETYLSTFLEEAAHAAAQGKDPSRYLATAVPTTLRDEIKRLRELLWRVLGTCLTADETGDLPEIFDGALLNEMIEALKGGGDE